uniref:Uncharacterized protein n=1 Tax=Oryza punctata TaxID=4537 RepID=A0A0E0LVQ6_ORYPU
MWEDGLGNLPLDPRGSCGARLFLSPHDPIIVITKATTASPPWVAGHAGAARRDGFDRRKELNPKSAKGFLKPSPTPKGFAVPKE